MSDLEERLAAVEKLAAGIPNPELQRSMERKWNKELWRRHQVEDQNLNDLLRYEEFIRLVATPKRADGTYCREALEQQIWDQMQLPT